MNHGNRLNAGTDCWGSAQRTGASHWGHSTEGQLRSSGRLRNGSAPPDYSIAAPFQVCMWLHCLALQIWPMADPGSMNELKYIAASMGFVCSHVVSDGHRQMQNETAWCGTKPIYWLLLNSLNWHSGFMSEEQFTSLFNSAFEHVPGYLKPVCCMVKTKKKLWPSYLTCYNRAGATLDLWMCKHTRTIRFILLPWALFPCLSQLTEPLHVFPHNAHFLPLVY